MKNCFAKKSTFIEFYFLHMQMALMFPAPIMIIADNEIFARISQKKSIKHIQNISTGLHYKCHGRKAKYWCVASEDHEAFKKVDKNTLQFFLKLISYFRISN